MKWELITPFLTFFAVLLVQVTVIPLLAIAGVIPDLVLITLVYYSISRDQFYGTVLGGSYGIFLDLITGSLLGSSMLSKTIAGFTAGYFSTETKKEINLSTYIFSLIVFICALIDSIVFSFFSAFDVQTNIFKLLFEQALLPSLYTALVSVLFIFSPFRRRKF
jgi:rod shape-determining protein MreD